MAEGSLRNMERIQETDEAPKTPKVVSVALVMLGGACIVFAAMALGGRHGNAPAAKADPLGDLVAARGTKPSPSGAKATDLSPSDVTFPGILSDDGKPTTALAAVKNNGPAATSTATAIGVDPVAPPPADRLAVVPLPAQNVLEATPLVTRPRDGLTKAAADAQTAPLQAGGAASAAAGPGHDGGYQLQVSSFRTQEEASVFADQLRARGHKAYVIEAKVPGRGTWYRVRIGPFQTQHAAASYRTTFEQREHVVPFIVPPASTTTK